MLNVNRTIRLILGPTRVDIRPLVYAVEIIRQRMFQENMERYDIAMTKDIYPEISARVYKDFGKQRNWKSTARQVERLAHLCWDAIEEQNLVHRYIGKPIKRIDSPSDMIFYLAFYVQFNGTSFYEVFRKNLAPDLIF